MASYNADINVNVNVFDRKLRELERRLQALDKIANPKKPLTKAQAAEQISKLKEELELTKRNKKIVDGIQETQTKLKKELRDQIRLRKEELSYEERSLRLANARKLQESRLTSLERAGAFEGKGRSAEISGLLRKRDQFSQNPAIQERVATALGRILTLQKAINRADIKNIGQKQRIDDYNKRIEALRRIGVSEGKLRNVIKRRAEFTTAADKRQDVIADKRERQLKRELQLLERKNRLALKAFNTETKIQSTPLSRAARRTVLGTPEAEGKKAAFYAKKAIEDAKELDRQEKLINKTLDDQRKRREKNAKAAKRLAEQQLRAAQRLGGPRSALPPRTILGSDEAIRNKAAFYDKKAIEDENRRIRARNRRRTARGRFAQNLSAGVGFPLLFGGGFGSIIGGALGAFGGFGGSVIGSGIGQLLDGVAESTATLGKALNPLTADINALTKAAGQSDTALGKLLEAYKDQDKAAEVLSATIGQKGVRDLRKYGAATAKLAQEFAKLGSQLQASLAPILIDITNFLANQAKKTRLDQKVFKNTFTGVELRAAFENEPALIKAVEKFNANLISEKDLLILGRRIALQREYTKELQVETELRTKAINESARTVQIERSRLAILLLSNKAFSEATFELKEQIALQEKELRDEKIRKEARTDAVKAARLRNDLAVSQIQYESRLVQISKERTAAEIQGIKERYALTQKLFDLEEQNISSSLRRIRDLGDVIARVNNALTAQKAAEMSRSKAELETNLVGGRDTDNIARQQAAITEDLRKRLGYEVEINGEKKKVLGLLDIEQSAALMSGVRSREEIDAIDARFDSLRRVARFEANTRYSILEIKKQELIAQEQLEESQRRAAFVADKSALEARIESPFGGNKLEQDLLEIEQFRRKTAELGKLQADIDAKIKAADELRAVNYVEKANRLDEEANRLREKLRLREQELTQIEELEMAELKLAQTVQDVYAFVGPAVSSLTSGLLQVINKTKSVEEAFADFLRNIADMLIQTATQMIAQYIAIGIARSFALGTQFSFSGGSADAGLEAANLMGGIGPLPKFADGGSPPVGRPSIVGERGPELFVPRSSGTIIPNDKMVGGSSNVVVNVDASGTKVQGDNNEASQLGKAIGAAVQAELVKQKRPGGLLAGV